MTVGSAGELEGSTFTNSTGGSVVNNGTFTDGTYVQDGGSNSGTPLSPSTLVLSGGGSASFAAVGMSVQGGPLMAGQSIDIPASGSMYLDNDLTNDGTITMDTSASGYSYLYLEGYTLTNAGTFSVPADGNSGSYAYVYSSGSFVNTGTVRSTAPSTSTGGGVDLHEQPRRLGGQQRDLHRRHLRPRRRDELGHPAVAVDAGPERGRDASFAAVA